MAQASAGDVQCDVIDVRETEVMTPRGPVMVTESGGGSSKTLVLLPDLGLTCRMCFQNFVNERLLKHVLAQVLVYQMDLPGYHSRDTQVLLQDYCYPNLEEIADIVLYVIGHFKVKQCVLFGLGLGANIALRCLAANPSLIDGVILVNPVIAPVGVLHRLFKVGKDPADVIKYINNYYFGVSRPEQVELPESVRGKCREAEEMASRHTAAVLAYIDSALQRSELPVVPKRLPVLLLVGRHCSRFKDSELVQATLPRASVEKVIYDCGTFLLDEVGSQAARALVYFLQGMRYSFSSQTQPDDGPPHLLHLLDDVIKEQQKLDDL